MEKLIESLTGNPLVLILIVFLLLKDSGGILQTVKDFLSRKPADPKPADPKPVDPAPAPEHPLVNTFVTQMLPVLLPLFIDLIKQKAEKDNEKQPE